MQSSKMKKIVDFELSQGSDIRCRVERMRERLPHQGVYQTEISPTSEGWVCKFKHMSIFAVFMASGIGQSPSDALSIVERDIEKQIGDWHQVRFTGQRFVGKAQKFLMVDEEPGLKTIFLEGPSQLNDLMD